MNTRRRSRLIVGVRIAVAAALAFFVSPTLHAADRLWVDPLGGGFADSGNWSPASVPGTADIANFTLNSSYTTTFSGAVTNTALEVENGNVTFDLNANTYTLTDGVDVGVVTGQTGRLTVTDGILAVDTSLDSVNIGETGGSTGFLTVTTGGRIGNGTVRPDILVGNLGTGTLTLTGMNAVADVRDARIGEFGTGTVSVTNGGTLTTSSGGIVFLGISVGSDGRMTVSGVGSSCTGGLNIVVGSQGEGALTISSGGLVSSPIGVLGELATGFGTATVTGTNSRWTVGTQTIGKSGLGVVNISGGGQIASTSGAILGETGSAEGRVSVTGAGSRWSLGGLTVGNLGTGDLTVSAGGEVSTASLILGNQGIGVATVTGAGSKLTTTGQLNLAPNGTGTLNVASGAEVYVGTGLTVNNPTGTPIGTLNLDGGSIFVAGDFTNNGAFNFTDGLLQVAGNFQPSTPGAVLTINGADNGDLPTLDLIGTGTTTNMTDIIVGSNRRGQLLLRQGRVFDVGSSSVRVGLAVGGEGTISVQSGAQFLTNGSLDIAGLAISRGTGTLNISGGTVDTNQLRLFTDGTINLNGGTLALSTLPVLDGQFNWTAGTLRFDSAFSLTSTNVPNLLGTDGTLGAGQALTSATGAAVTLNTSIVVDGGTLSASSLVNNSTLEVRSGSASVALTTANNAGAHLFVERNLSLGGTLTNASGARLELAGGTGRLIGAGAVQNSGLIVGDGTITNAVTNSAPGRIRVDAGKTLFFTGTFAPNAGELNLQGGTLDFSGPVTNSSTGFIAGRGALYTGGLTNDGQMAFSGGTADVHGDVTLTAGSRVVTSGAASVTTFFDDVVHNGREIFTGASTSTVFFGSQTGAGNFTGTGTIYFIGDLRPGNSPAAVSFEGDVAFGASSRLTLEIAGPMLGVEYDHLEVDGTIFIDGILEIALLGGYVPAVGDIFDVLDAGAFTGEYDAIAAPELPGDRRWDFTGLKTTGTVTVVPEPGSAVLMLLGAALLGWPGRGRPNCPHDTTDFSRNLESQNS